MLLRNFPGPDPGKTLLVLPAAFLKDLASPAALRSLLNRRRPQYFAVIRPVLRMDLPQLRRRQIPAHLLCQSKGSSDGVGQRCKYRRLTECSGRLQPVRKKILAGRLVLLCPFSAARFLQDFFVLGFAMYLQVCHYDQRPKTRIEYRPAPVLYSTCVNSATV